MEAFIRISNVSIEIDGNEARYNIKYILCVKLKSGALKIR